MLGRKDPQKAAAAPLTPTNGHAATPISLLTVVGEHAKMEGKFDIADSIQVECEVGGELKVGGKLVIGEKGVVNANVETVDAIIMGHYDGNMTATGNVEITTTGRVSGNIKTDSLVISKGGCFSGNVSKINDESSTVPRPVYLVEDKRASQGAPR
jgi:cytoskeletal protein CcmA (bactofilin family)